MGPCVRRGDRCECGCRIGTDFTCQTACHVQTQLRDLTACLARVLPFRSALLQQRAQGMPDARCTRGRVCSKKAHALATTGTPHQPAFPARWFYGLYVISPVTGLFCHRRFAGMTPRTLAPASGRQNHTTSPSATALLV